MTFIPLHTHSWYSLLQATPSLETLLGQAVDYGYDALALTDTNNLYGMPAFALLAQNRGVRPILGACLHAGGQHAVALCANRTGYHNLCRILSRLHLDEAAADLRTLLLTWNAGLHLLLDDLSLAEALRDTCSGRLWLELVRPPRSREHERRLLAGAEQLQLPLVASTAAHLASTTEYETFRLVTAVRQGKLLDQIPAQLSIRPLHCLPVPRTVEQRFRDLPQAIRNTRILAEMLEASVLPRNLVLPPARVPRHLDEMAFLASLCERGLHRRGLATNAPARERLHQELPIIARGGLAGYFLVVRDIARHARHRGHGMALRGSAGNSLVCYLLGITNVDPLRFDLPLERFLHPGRADLPDIDLDFDWKVRDEIIAWVFERHGHAHTAMISSHLFLQPRSAFREAARTHGLSNDQVTRLLEGLAERVEPLIANASHPAPLPPRFPLEPGRWQRVVADARRLLGRPHHLSIHPGGVVITPRPIDEYVPLQRAAKGIVITQYEKDAIEDVGLVKIDLLGNRAVGTVDEIHRTSQRLSISLPSTVHPEDPATVALLQRGDSLGINQLESPAMRHLLIQMQPRGLHDVIQALALIRPGAATVGAKETFIRRRRGLEPIQYAHPCLEPLLRETEGLMLYEDDALRVLETLTGYSAPQADRFRKRIARHRSGAEAEQLLADFLAACRQNGIGDELAGDFWVQLAKFNHYSFCKSHAVSYGLIAWRAAWLKVHQPQLFWTAALNNNQGMYPRRVYTEAIKRSGIPLYLPCVNRSELPFQVEDVGIRVGLEAIRGFPSELANALLDNRTRHGPFRDLADFRHRLQPGRESLALLLRCGAFDFLERPRPELFLEAELEDLVRPGSHLFDESLQSTWAPPHYADHRQRLDEWEVLDFVVGPPLAALVAERMPEERVRSTELANHLGRTVRVAGVVATARHAPTVHGDSMQFVSLEDETGLIDLTLFPRVCPPIAYLTLGPWVALGRVEEQYGVITVTAQRFEHWTHAEHTGKVP